MKPPLKKGTTMLSDTANFVVVLATTLGFIALVYILATIQEKIEAMIIKGRAAKTTTMRIVKNAKFDPFDEIKF